MNKSIAKNSWVIIVILIFASFLRILGVWNGYPYSFYPDEVHFVKRALSFGSMDFNPHWFHKPAFYMYLLFFEYGIYFLIGKVIGLWASASDFAVAYIKNPGPFYIIGRLTTVLFSVGSIWVTYRFGERHYKQGSGVIAALLLTLSYGHVAASQDIKADTPAMFFAIISMYFLFNYLEKANVRDLVLAAVLAGVGAATKKYPIVMLVPIILSIIIYCKNRGGIRNIFINIGIVLVMFYLAYFLCAPFNFIDPLGRKSTFGFIIGLPQKIYNVFSGVQVEHAGDFIDQKTGFWEGYIDYFKVLIAADGMGIIISSISFSGMIYLFINASKKVIIFFLFPIVFVIISVFTFPGYAEVRHQLPIYPFLAISGGAFIVFLTGDKAGREKIVLTMLVLSLCLPLYKIIERGIEVSRPDTRNIAKAWIESNIPSNTKLLMDENGPQLLINKNSINKTMEIALTADSKGQFTAHYDTYLNYQLLAAEGSIAYDIDEIRFPWWRSSEGNPGVYHAISEYDKDMGNPLKPVGVMSFEFYKENGYEYVIISSKMYVKFLKEDTNKVNNFPSFSRFYKTLFNEGQLIKGFIPEQGISRGPVIKIFKVR